MRGLFCRLLSPIQATGKSPATESLVSFERTPNLRVSGHSTTASMASETTTQRNDNGDQQLQPEVPKEQVSLDETIHPDTEHVSDDPGSEDSVYDPLESVPAIETSKLNRVQWEEFKRPKKDGEPVFVIDILVGEPNMASIAAAMVRDAADVAVAAIASAAAADWGNDKTVRAAAAAAVATAITGPPSQRRALGIQRSVFAGQAPLPERIRINSPTIIKILSLICKKNISKEVRDRDTGEFQLQPVVMMRPFRALMFFKDEIRVWPRRLEEILAKTAGAGQNGEEEGEGEGCRRGRNWRARSTGRR